MPSPYIIIPEFQEPNSCFVIRCVHIDKPSETLSYQIIQLPTTKAELNKAFRQVLREQKKIDKQASRAAEIAQRKADAQAVLDKVDTTITDTDGEVTPVVVSPAVEPVPVEPPPVQG